MSKFSDRLGFTKPRDVIQIECMDQALLNGLWNTFSSAYMYGLTRQQFFGSCGTNTKQTVYDYHITYLKGDADNILKFSSDIKNAIKKQFMTNEWFEPYNIIEFFLNHPSQASKFAATTKNLNYILEERLSGYRIIDGQVTPISDNSEITAIEEALTSNYDEVNTHLSTALNHLSNRSTPDFRNSIKESISAVESYCRLELGDGATLGQLLKKIESETGLHPSQKEAFSRLYGWTSDKNSGIRHGLIDQDSIDHADAKYMLVTCSAFINYLKDKKTHNITQMNET